MQLFQGKSQANAATTVTRKVIASIIFPHQQWANDLAHWTQDIVGIQDAKQVGRATIASRGHVQVIGNVIHGFLGTS